MAEPTSRLHGPSLSGPSTSGSAAAPVSDPAPPALSAPASTTPRPSSARRSISPLPATNSNGGDFPEALRFPSLMAVLPNFLRRRRGYQSAELARRRRSRGKGGARQPALAVVP